MKRLNGYLKAGLLLTGFLGGYPTGAQCVSQARSSGKLTKAQAERMIAVCSNAGPSFLFGMVSQMCTESSMVWLLWAVHILSAVLVAVLLLLGILSIVLLVVIHDLFLRNLYLRFYRRPSLPSFSSFILRLENQACQQAGKHGHSDAAGSGFQTAGENAQKSILLNGFLDAL